MWRIAAVGFVVLTGLVAGRVRPVPQIDAAVSDAARRFALVHTGWRSVMSLVTHSADSRVLVPLGLLAVALLLWRRQWTAVGFLLATATTATVIRFTVLALVHRPRPVDRLTAAAGWAYPSGHTTSAAITAGILIVLGCAVLTGRRARAALIAVAVTWAVLVGVSRVALVAHWPSDVLGGWLLAATVTALFAASPLRPRIGIQVQRSFR